MQEIQHELDVTNEDLANKNEDLNELRELIARLQDHVTRGQSSRVLLGYLFFIYPPTCFDCLYFYPVVLSLLTHVSPLIY